MPRTFLFLTLLMFICLSVYPQSVLIDQNGVEKVFPEDFRTQGPKVGNVFPFGFEKTIEGEQIENTALSNKTVLVKIWFVGCTGCVQEELFLKDVRDSFSGNPEVLFLGICMSSPEKAMRYIKKKSDFGYKTVHLNRKEVEMKYGVVTSPTHFIVKDGIVAEKFTLPVFNKEIANWLTNRILTISKN
ncbi:TlpA family protein disulfide reductase [Mariniradius saccharolyticus]|nr:TlpA disulfide reductase family protein [Mariniradius saccharolyticus]